ncbi:conserved hypothetical protein [Vibrio chagasii]|uniref:Uncharacterized protein n=2 Tax=Vibrio cyclitrophicus TaxID=47951 RepID=A0A7Z1MMH8_9VIBR|nr:MULTISPECIES: hypothetical protein [Vibrio]CAH6842634.1 conserved hypothetical protein [Vibrio chagasii]PME16779.1 hypothetical protein BCV44_13330 [Vibrio cyclitrophicus]PMP14491.1 hypothetical protein BCS91_11550 [Vibrio cyclitrophicus]PMP33017.1 hypothetical protein BCS90_09790 [Vibrio cyclitrophicus]TCN95804.1 hypothetical protein EDB51_117121 [Vibrio crassostreae]
MKVFFHGKFSELFEDIELQVQEPQVVLSGLNSRYPTFKRLMLAHKGQYVIDDEGMQIFPEGEGAQWLVLAMQIFSAVSAVVGVAVAINQKMIEKSNKRKQGRESESYLFDGIINTDTQGGSVPLTFGHAYVGSTVINNELDAY